MATANKKKFKKEHAFLNSKGATPTEIDIWFIVFNIYAKTSKPVASGQITAKTETHRTGIRWHLTNMIRKGIIEKSSHRFYKPVRIES